MPYGVSEQGNILQFGGVTYNTAEVKLAKQNEDGTYELLFNSGTTLTYPAQQPQADGETPHVSATAEEGKGKLSKTAYDVQNIVGAVFTSSKQDISRVLVHNCPESRIDLAANDSKKYGDTAVFSGDNHGTTFTYDKNDEVYDVDSFSGKAGTMIGCGSSESEPWLSGS